MHVQKNAEVREVNSKTAQVSSQQLEAQDVFKKKQPLNVLNIKHKKNIT